VTPCASCTPGASRRVRYGPQLVTDLGGRDQGRSAPSMEVHRRGYSRGYSDDLFYLRFRQPTPRKSESTVDLVGERDMATVPELVALTQALVASGPSRVVS
jgi:hypothetical protein